MINNNEFTIRGPTGFIGMGFESNYWPAYVDYNSSQASYTIASWWIQRDESFLSKGPQLGVSLGASVPDFYKTRKSTVFSTQNVDAAVFAYEQF
jgi:hypothetical protein